MPRAIRTPQEATVLIVEDDPSNMLVAQKLLQVAGVKPDHIYGAAGDPLPLLQGELQGRVDLVLLDLHLPGKDGYTILQEIRTDPLLADVIVVALTANVMLPNVNHAQEAGFDGFISKPIDGRRFADWIRRLLAGEAVWIIEH
ncbi:MAG: response regulator [Ardenticatenaceae bacterium]|nr:response regulator [Ardenticatenaceae bacterium]